MNFTILWVILICSHGWQPRVPDLFDGPSVLILITIIITSLLLLLLLPPRSYLAMSRDISVCHDPGAVGEGRMLLTSKGYRGLPWWRSGWESACQCRGYGFEPWSGKIPYAAEQLGPWATTTEPAHLEPVLCNKRGHDNERPVHRDEEWPPLAATRESPRTEAKTQHSHKNK